MDFHMIVLRKSFYICWSAGRSPRVHEPNPGRDPSSGDISGKLTKRKNPHLQQAESQPA